MANLRKISLALDPAIVADLDYLSSRLGVSRSALVSQLLADTTPTMRKLLEQVPLSPAPADAVRFRGDSIKVIEGRLSDVRELGHDLFSKL